MKLSEAMMLGSTLVKLEAGQWEACALGAAMAAISVPANRRSSLTAMMLWPWLQPFVSGGFEMEGTIERRNRRFCVLTRSYLEAVIGRFDHLVSTGRMTLEQLADYVRSVEPACGTCNRFECTCAPATVKQEEVEAVCG